MTTVLKPTKKDIVPDDTNIFQTSDGTIYYWKYTPTSRLYVNWQGKEIEADLHGQEIDHVGVHDNAIYFRTGKRVITICKAVFSETKNGLEVSFQRNQLKDETLNDWGMFTRVRNGNKYAYELWQDPNKDGVIIAIQDGILDDLELIAVHRGKALYVYTTPPNYHRLSVRKLRENIIVIEDDSVDLIAHINESSRFIYLLLKSKIYTLDMTTMEFLPTLRMEGVDGINDFVGVHNGEIIVDAKINDDWYLVTATLPDGYHDNTSVANKNCEMVQGFEERIKKMSNEMNIAKNSIECYLDMCCCSICSENFDSATNIPRYLDCGHTFCHVCIYNVNLRINNMVKCPNCKLITVLPDGKVLPKNFTLISMTDQLMKTRVDPKITCKACQIKFSSSAICMCVKDDCVMYSQFLCLNCTIDGGHGAHVVKYNTKVEKIRKELRKEVKKVCSELEDKKKIVRDKTVQLTDMFAAINMNLNDANIPSHVLQQLDTIATEEEAASFKKKVNDLANKISNQCDTLIQSFDGMIDYEKNFQLLDDTNTP